MRTKLIFLSSLVLAIVLVFLFHKQLRSGIQFFQDKQGSKIKFAEEEFDFGNLAEGSVAEHTFEFINAGTDTLIIAQVRASCGCTAALLNTNRIPPQGTGEIKTTFKTKGRAGKQKKTLTVFSNDQETPAKTLIFHAFIEPAAKQNP
jgi:hypothetical protein